MLVIDKSFEVADDSHLVQRKNILDLNRFVQTITIFLQYNNLQ